MLIHGCSMRGSALPCIAASVTASVSSRPRLPGGLVSWAWRASAAARAASSSGLAGGSQSEVHRGFPFRTSGRPAATNSTSSAELGEVLVQPAGLVDEAAREFAQRDDAEPGFVADQNQFVVAARGQRGEQCGACVVERGGVRLAQAVGQPQREAIDDDAARRLPRGSRRQDRAAPRSCSSAPGARPGGARCGQPFRRRAPGRWR